MTTCFHCGQPVVPGQEVYREIDRTEKTLCCNGCATVAAIIFESGLQSYYRKRTSLPAAPVDRSGSDTDEAISVFADQLIQEQIVTAKPDSTSQTELIVQNMHCPTCVWLIERKLSSLPGVQKVDVVFRTQKLSVRWKAAQITLPTIVKTVRSLGYSVVPYSQTALTSSAAAQQKDLLKRLGVAGIFGMQVMVIAVALYASDFSSIDPLYEELFRRLSLLFILPVMFYSAAPIFIGAIRDLKQFSATMDVPIALGLSIAFVASFHATLIADGEIYYDSIAMFAFLQLAARYLEAAAFKTMTDRISALTSATPAYANQLLDPAQMDSAKAVAALRLAVGDWVLVKPGETVPADGQIHSGATDIDESILTGESDAIRRIQDNTVLGGSINLTNAIVVRITKKASESTLAAIANLLEDSISIKPRSKRLTDQVAGKFSAAVVALAAAVAVFWIWNDNSGWMAITISVLVVACPCALALAVPTALTAAVNAAARKGILLSHPDAVQPLARSKTFLFDKTGTLTHRQATLMKIVAADEAYQKQYVRIASALSQFSDHPIARALSDLAVEHPLKANDVISSKPGGISGLCEGKNYFLGSSAYIQHVAGVNLAPENSAADGLIAHLSDDERVLVSFLFQNQLRSDSGEVVAELMKDAIRIEMVTGDRQSEALRIASALDIEHVHWNCSPSEKLNVIRQRQSQGHCVAMVGDGINDAPTLATADISIAPATAQQIAKVHADILLLDDNLKLLTQVRKLARRTASVMRSNTIWAVAYNLAGISLAATGNVPPLAAAIGMSVSSLIVVGNSLRVNSS